MHSVHSNHTCQVTNQVRSPASDARRLVYTLLFIYFRVLGNYLQMNGHETLTLIGGKRKLKAEHVKTNGKKKKKFQRGSSDVDLLLLSRNGRT